MELVAGLLASWITEKFKNAHWIATGDELTIKALRLTLAILSVIAAIIMAIVNGQTLDKVDWSTLLKALLEAGYVFIVAIGAYYGVVKPADPKV